MHPIRRIAKCTRCGRIQAGTDWVPAEQGPEDPSAPAYCPACMQVALLQVALTQICRINWTHAGPKRLSLE